jgi:hypothetical protein
MHHPLTTCTRAFLGTGFFYEKKPDSKEILRSPAHASRHQCLSLYFEKADENVSARGMIKTEGKMHRLRIHHVCKGFRDTVFIVCANNMVAHGFDFIHSVSDSDGIAGCFKHTDIIVIVTDGGGIF